MRTRWLHVALRTLPGPDREGLGAELEGTVLDAQPQSWPRFIAELLHVARFGASRRATAIARSGAGHVLLGGARRGALLVCAILIISASVSLFAPPGPPPTMLPVVVSMLLLVGTLGLGLTGLDRAAGITGVCWVFHPVLVGYPSTWQPGVNLVLLLVFGAMTAFPRTMGRRPRRLAWLNLPVWLLAVTTGSNTALSVTLFLIVSALLLTALLTSVHDPRWTIAACVVGAQFFSTDLGDPKSAVVTGLAAATAWTVAVWFTRARRPASGSPA